MAKEVDKKEEGGRVPVRVEGKENVGKKKKEEEEAGGEEGGPVEGQKGGGKEEEGEGEVRAVEEECWKPPPQVLPTGAPVQVGRKGGREGGRED